jgi:hypothetical protein
MSKELTVVTNDTLIDVLAKPTMEDVACREVVAVSFGRTALLGGQVLRGDEQEHTLTWPHDQAERLLSFYEHFFTEPRPDPQYDCRIFAYNVAAGIGYDRAFDRAFYFEREFDVDHDSLQTGRPYGVRKPGVGINHALLGTDDPTENLSVLGSGGRLLMMPNSTIKEIYKGTIVGVEGISSDFAHAKDNNSAANQ